MGEWGAQSFQAVWFTPQAPVDASAIFAGIVGAKPDNIMQQSIGVALAHGSDGLTQFRVQAQPGRIDYFETAVGEPAKSFPLILNFKDTFPIFARRILAGVTSVGDANRLAVVVMLAKEIDSLGEPTTILGELLGLKMPFKGAENIGFQINRRRTFDNRSDLEMNRLLTMHLQNLQQFDMINPTSPVLKAIDLVNVSIDCNTFSTEILTLPPDDQLPIWKELISECERLCSAKNINALS